MESGVDTQAVDNFLRLARGAQTKEDYISRVREFDQKFVDAYPSPVISQLPNMPNIPKANTPQNIAQKQQIPQPPKNPFITIAQEKFRFTSSQMAPNPNPNQYKIPQPPSTRRQFPPQNIPHSRSQTNFYRQPQFDPSYIYDNGTGPTYEEQLLYRQNMMDRSYSNAGQAINPRYNNSYQTPQQAYNSQPYIQQNQFLQNFQSQEPSYVKFYKKQIPMQEPKASFTPTARSNPFKQ